MAFFGFCTNNFYLWMSIPKNARHKFMASIKCIGILTSGGDAPGNDNFSLITVFVEEET